MTNITWDFYNENDQVMVKFHLVLTRLGLKPQDYWSELAEQIDLNSRGKNEDGTKHTR